MTVLLSHGFGTTDVKLEKSKTPITNGRKYICSINCSSMQNIIISYSQKNSYHFIPCGFPTCHPSFRNPPQSNLTVPHQISTTLTVYIFYP